MTSSLAAALQSFIKDELQLHKNYEFRIITVYTYHETCEWQSHMSLDDLSTVTNWHVSYLVYFQGKFRIHKKYAPSCLHTAFSRTGKSLSLYGLYKIIIIFRQFPLGTTSMQILWEWCFYPILTQEICQLLHCRT